LVTEKEKSLEFELVCDHGVSLLEVLCLCCVGFWESVICQCRCFFMLKMVVFNISCLLLDPTNIVKYLNLRLLSGWVVT
jgi:hypothetical protein